MNSSGSIPCSFFSSSCPSNVCSDAPFLPVCSFLHASAYLDMRQHFREGHQTFWQRKDSMYHTNISLLPLSYHGCEAHVNVRCSTWLSSLCRLKCFGMQNSSHANRCFFQSRYPVLVKEAVPKVVCPSVVCSEPEAPPHQLEFRFRCGSITGLLVGLTATWILQCLCGLEPSPLQIQPVRFSCREDVSR